MIIRAPHDQNYTSIRREGLQDDRLSWAARGIWAYLLSKPDGWEVNVKHLVAAGDIGERPVRRALNELTAAGYIVRKSRKSVHGQFDGIDVEVHELPQLEESPGETGRPNQPSGVTRENTSKVQVKPDDRIPTDGKPSRRFRSCIESSELESSETSESSELEKKAFFAANAAESLAQAKEIMDPWWRSSDRKPFTTPYMAIAKRVQEALDGGHSPEAVAAVLPQIPAFTRGCIDFALNHKDNHAPKESLAELGRRVFQHEQDADRRRLAR